jgi:hypothetical protein
MSYNILIIIGIALLSIFLICYKVKENFQNETPLDNNVNDLNPNIEENNEVIKDIPNNSNNNLNNIPNNSNNNLNNIPNNSNNNLNNITNNEEISMTPSNSNNNIPNDESQNVLNNLLNVPNNNGNEDNRYVNAGINIGGSDYYQLNLLNTEINTEEAEVNLDFKMPEMILESVGVRKLIIHWQSEVPNDYIVTKYNINVYKCKDLELCNIEDAEEITGFDTPTPRCKSCYLIINNIDMGNHTYIVKIQIVYQNINTGQLVMGPTDMKTTVKEVEQDLTKMYKDALDHLIDENIEQKKVDMEQYLQKKKIDELRNKIINLKSNLLKSEKYSGDLNQMLKSPFPIKTYYNGIDFFDAKKPTQQTIKYGDSEYYIGLTNN